MAEIKNTFIKSKMNQDLDSRLISNGEYREGVNIAVSQAEGADVGTLQNVLGNISVTDFGLDENCNVNIIGYLVDDQNEDIYFFLTNFIDTSVSKLSNYPPNDVICQIWKRSIDTNINIKLVEGKFLNFSLTHHITGVNLLEDLLFWTDNRNQPRKINVTKANPARLNNPTYYTNDDQINVAKYYPFEPISLIRDYIVDFSITSPGTGEDYINYLYETVPTSGGSGSGLIVKITNATSGLGGELTGVEIISQGFGYEDGDVVTIAPRVGSAAITLVVQTASSMKDTCTEVLPFHCVYGGSSRSLTKSSTFDVTAAGWTKDSGVDISTEYIGTLVKVESSTDQAPYLARITAVVGTDVTIEWPNGGATDVIANVISLTIGINPDYDATWPGDCQYLKEKFVRFAYRFKFTDNEYSLISPFTQACFIPKQDGYFLKEEKTLAFAATTEEVLDTEQAFDSTENLIMVNKVTNVELLIPCPIYLDSTKTGFDNIEPELHVKSIDIIYKDDNDSNLRLLDTISPAQFVIIDNQFLYYNYQSRSPQRTLPESEIVRVSDRVPLRAKSQEISGNRVIYGNFVDGFTSNDFLDYEVGAALKASGEFGSRREYQNHTLKQNRSYQVGVVLSDRYGRQSDVVLSNIDLESTTDSNITYQGSTVFHPYYGVGFSPSELISGTNSTWPGDALRVKFNNTIPENTGQVGYPGLFRGYEVNSATSLYGGNAYTGPGATNVETATTGVGLGLTVDYVTFKSTGLSYIISVVINQPGSGYVDGDVISINDPVIPAPAAGTDYATFIYNSALNPNLTGWHSYKIVVKQQDQDYYNVYLPGIVNGAINKDGVESTTLATVSLFGDNINKVPKDLTNIGPSQTNFNSNEILSLRVENTINFASTQFYPGVNTERVTQISELSDLGISLQRRMAVVGAGPVSGTTFPLTTFSEDTVFPGMSVTSVSSTGSTRITPSNGVYIVAYYATGGTAEVVFNKSLIVTGEIDAGDVLTFGPPGIIYNSSNNPLIGIMSTSEQIGVPEEDEFSAQLAVMETRPVPSLLNIFYETTSSDLVTTLNTAITEGIPGAYPANISPVQVDINESIVGTSVITNDFSLLDNANSPFLTVNASGSLINVLDGDQNDVTSLFKINNLGTGYFNISTNRSPGEGWYVGNDENLVEFEFTVSLESDGAVLYKTFDGEMGNIRPTYNDVYDGSSFYLDKAPVTKFPRGLDTVWDYFQATNGSGDTTLQGKELLWTLTSAILKDGQNNPRPNNYVWYQVSWLNGYIASPSSTTTYEPFQYLKNNNYVDLFTVFDADDASNQGVGSVIAKKIQFSWNGINTINNGATYSYVYDPIVGYQNSALGSQFGTTPVYGDAVTGNSKPDYLIDWLEFELTFEAVDASGGMGSLAADPIIITVKVQ